ncbi:MAG: sulfatase-like hydrolase/transferase [bacterium]|nr:sulfatase-like hydrolase/transferase [bacterium]
MATGHSSKPAGTNGLTRRSFVRTIATGAATVASASQGSHANAQAPARRPNILLLFSDQHQAACLGFQNHPDAITPNLDKLAKSGTVFNRAYCQDAVCVPSRMSLMTGLYPRHLGILHNPDNTSVADEVVSLQSALKSRRLLHGGLWQAPPEGRGRSRLGLSPKPSPR